MPDAQQLLITYAIPGVISLLAALIAWRPWSGASPRGHWAMTVALGLVLIVVVIRFAYQYKPPGWPPAQAEDWLFWAGIALLLLGLLDAFVPLWGEVRALLYLILAAALCYLLIRGVANRWEAHRVIVDITGPAVLIVLAGACIERTSEKNPGWAVPLVLLIAAGALAPWPLLHGSADFTFRAATLPVVLLPFVAVAAWAKQFTLSRGGAMAFAVLYGSMLVMCAGRLTDLPAWQAVVLAAAPVVPLIPLWTPLRGWKKPAVALAVALIMTLAVLIPAFVAWQKQQASPEAFWGA